MMIVLCLFLVYILVTYSSSWFIWFLFRFLFLALSWLFYSLISRFIQLKLVMDDWLLGTKVKTKTKKNKKKIYSWSWIKCWWLWMWKKTNKLKYFQLIIMVHKVSKFNLVYFQTTNQTIYDTIIMIMPILFWETLCWYGIICLFDYYCCNYIFFCGLRFFAIKKSNV